MPAKPRPSHEIETPVRIVAFDPSSTALGWARLDVGRGSIREAQCGVHRLRTRGRVAFRRVADAADHARRLIELFAPRVVVIEGTSGKVHARHRGSGAGLAVYGMAVGAVMESARRLAPACVVVSERAWTAGKPKPERLRDLIYAYPWYRDQHDPGGDAGDALALADWYARMAAVEWRGSAAGIVAFGDVPGL